MTVPVGEGPAPLSGVSCMGTTVWTNPATSCSHLVVPQVQVLQCSMAKEACTTFEVWAKQLSKLLLGKVYLGGTSGATKGKQKWSHTMACEGDIAGDDCSPPTKK